MCINMILQGQYLCSFLTQYFCGSKCYAAFAHCADERSILRITSPKPSVSGDSCICLRGMPISSFNTWGKLLTCYPKII